MRSSAHRGHLKRRRGTDDEHDRVRAFRCPDAPRREVERLAKTCARVAPIRQGRRLFASPLCHDALARGVFVKLKSMIESSLHN
jgi:hypothetical protein